MYVEPKVSGATHEVHGESGDWSRNVHNKENSVLVSTGFIDQAKQADTAELDQQLGQNLRAELDHEVFDFRAPAPEGV